jgi:phage shock protein C
MAETTRLSRSTSDRMLAGVCAGIAEHFGWDPTLVRVGFVFLSVLSAAFPGLLVYIIMWIVMPER